VEVYTVGKLKINISDYPHVFTHLLLPSAPTIFDGFCEGNKFEFAFFTKRLVRFRFMNLKTYFNFFSPLFTHFYSHAAGCRGKTRKMLEA
jgi:hypothetical protein